MTPYVAHPDSGQYTDDGCEHSPSCLNCPLPMCKHDGAFFWQLAERRVAMRQRNQRRQDRANRDRMIANLRSKGLSYKQITERLGVGRGTIARAIKRGPDEATDPLDRTDTSQTRSPLNLGSPYRERAPLPPIRRAM